MLSQKNLVSSPGNLIGKCLIRFCLGAVAAMLYYLQAEMAEPRFLLLICLLLIPAAGTVFCEERLEALPFFYAGELLLLLTAVLPMVLFWLVGSVSLRVEGYRIAERNSLLLGSLVIVLPSMLSAGGYRQNLLDRPVAAEGVLFLAAYLWAVWNEAGYGYRFFLYALSVVFLLLYFYRKNQHGRQLFLEAAGEGAKKEQEGYIRQVNRRSLLPFLLLVLLLSVLVWIPMGSQALTEAVQEQYSSVMDRVNEWMTGIPEDFAGMFGEPPQEEDSEEKVRQESGEALPEAAQEETELWLLKALIQGTMLFFALLTAAVLFLLLRQASRRREQKSQNEMQREYELTITEKSVRLKRKRFRRRPVADAVPENRRVRQLYRETIRRGLIRRDRRYQTMTPEELEYEAGVQKNKAALEALHQLYEKARYGREACTREEQRKAEAAAERLKRQEE